MIASRTTPSVRPLASTIPGVAVASPARINLPNSPIVRVLAFNAASVQPSGQPASERADLLAGQAPYLFGHVIASPPNVPPRRLHTA